jgi:hypothetical protein
MENNEWGNSKSEYPEVGRLEVYSPIVQTNEPIRTISIGPSGLGGWLVLVGIGRVLSPILVLRAILFTFLPQLTNGTMDLLSQPGSAAYSSLWRPTILFELCSNIIMLIFGIMLLFLFFGKKKLFPKMFIGVMILQLVIVVIDAVFVYMIQSSISVSLNVNPISPVIRQLVNAGVWIPYTLVSARVKNTFIR